MTAKPILEQLRGGLIASCQPVEHGPMDRDDIVVAMALACVEGGARGLRIEGAARVQAVAMVCNVPIVGIVKRDLIDSPVRITPFLDDVHALADAGAAIIAFDGTDRPRPELRENLLDTIRQTGCLAMADCSNFAEATSMAQAGCDFVATTMSGYTSADTPDEPDLDFVTACAKAGFCTIAEGRFNSPGLAAAAIAAGAHSVTVGSAITRIEHIAGWFCRALAAAGSEPIQ